jgi:threonine/homoserine/homoserine lactone efflux protein
MFETIIQFPIGFVVALSGALIPGPLLAFVIAKSLTRGAVTGPLAATGHMVVELGILSLLTLGLSHLIRGELFRLAVGSIGGMMLLVIGLFNLLKSETRIRKPIGIGYHPLVGGVAFSTILNPAVPVWWATIGFAMLMEAVLVASFIGVILWLLGHWLADYGWFSLVSYSVAKGGLSLGTKGHKLLVTLCSGMLLIFGSYFIYKYAFLILF